MSSAVARIMRVLAAALAALTTLGASAQPSGKPLPLPDVRKPVVLRVAYIHNPRFEPLPAERLGRILALTAAHVKRYLGVTVSFTPPVEVPIIKVFGALAPRLAAEAESQRLDGAVNEFAIDRLSRALLKDLQQESDLPAQKRFAAQYLVTPPTDAGDMAFARALINTQLSLLKTWQALKGADGQPLIGKDRFNEYAYWNLLGATPLPYEVLVTNQLVASAEWEGNSVHSALRGGVSNGVTTQNRQGRFQLFSMLSTFPFLDDSPQTVALRGGDTPSPEEADNDMALLLAHELGHQLLHLGHPFSNPACLMAPPPVLRFREWAAGLSAAECPVGPGGNRENVPGFVKFAAPEAIYR